MKNKRIIKDILKLHPELEEDKNLLKKTVRFLRKTQPEVMINKKFKSNLGEKLATLASMKSSSVDALMKKPIFMHIFGGLFASLLAFFGLFYVFSDTLFYNSNDPIISDYEAQISDIDPVQETRLEIQSSGGISESTQIVEDTIIESSKPEIQTIEKNIEIKKPVVKQLPVKKIALPKKIVPTIITPDVEVKSQLEFSEPTESQEIPTIEQKNSDNNTISDKALSSPSQGKSVKTPPDAQESTGNRLIGEEVDGLAPGLQDSSFGTGIFNSVGEEDIPEYGEEDILETEIESVDEFTLRCDVFGGEVSIRNEIRVCNIGDIVCNESDFLKGVCELGQ